MVGGNVRRLPEGRSALDKRRLAYVWSELSVYPLSMARCALPYEGSIVVRRFSLPGRLPELMDTHAAVRSTRDRSVRLASEATSPSRTVIYMTVGHERCCE